MAVEIAVIPVAGQGTRLLPSTKSQPKEMLPVGRKPVVQYVVEELAQCGIHQLLFVTGPGKTSIENHFDINPELIAYLRGSGREELLAELQFERRDVEYFYTRQRRQLGLGHAVLCSQSLVGDRPFIVALGDSILGVRGHSNAVARMIDAFERHKADAVIAVEEVPAADITNYGVVRPATAAGDVFEIADLIEKPSRVHAPSNLAVAARYVCSPAIFGILKQTSPGIGDQIQLTDALKGLIDQKGKVLGVRLSEEERRYDVGDFPSYFRAFVDFALADPRYGEGLKEHLANVLKQST